VARRRRTRCSSTSPGLPKAQLTTVVTDPQLLADGRKCGVAPRSYGHLKVGENPRDGIPDGLPIEIPSQAWQFPILPAVTTLGTR
jgi:hypothetical protein